MEPLKLNYIVKSLKNANVGIGEERKSFGCHFVCVEYVYYGESNNRAHFVHYHISSSKHEKSLKVIKHLRLVNVW